MACVTGAGAGVDNAWEQRKLEATLRELLDAKRAARPSESPASSSTLCWTAFMDEKTVQLLIQVQQHTYRQGQVQGQK